MMKLVYSLGAVVAAGSVSLIPIGGEAHAVTDESADSVDMSALSPAKPSRELRLLFIHHSVGGQLFSNPGERKDVADSIHLSHENGGGLRQSLEEFGYEVHEASYGRRIGQDPDLVDWLPQLVPGRPRHPRALAIHHRRVSSADAQSRLGRIQHQHIRAPPGRPGIPWETVTWDFMVRTVSSVPYVSRSGFLGRTAHRTVQEHRKPRLQA